VCVSAAVCCFGCGAWRVCLATSWFVWFRLLLQLSLECFVNIGHGYRTTCRVLAGPTSQGTQSREVILCP
jgi:hypothetical protein